MSCSDRSSTAKVRTKALYIEDNSANIKLMRDIFSEFLSSDFISVTNAEDGIEVAREQLPDLILMDLNMDGMSGYQALSIMKADAELEGIPVIAVSGDIMPEHLEKARVAGFIDYVSKPFDIMTFVETMKQYLN